MLKLSRFTHVFSKDDLDYVAVYNSITLRTVFIEKAAADQAFGLLPKMCGYSDHGLVKQLMDLGYIVDSDIAESIPEEVEAHLQPALCVMYLILTDYCNLGCKYCFIEAGFPSDYKCGSMTWDVAKKAIDIFSKQREKDRVGQVWFYGGEPLLESDLFFRVLDYLTITDPKVVPAIVTNGTCITNDIAKRIATYPKLHVAVSLDGPAYINDQKRVFKDGRGSYVSVKAGIDNLKDAGVDYGISCTIAEHNVDSIAEVIRWLSDEFHTGDIGVNLLVDTPRDFVDEDYIHRANDGILKSFDTERYGSIYEGRILRKVNAFVKGEPRWNDCAACGRQFVVAPSGEIGICHEGLGERRTFVGSIFEDFDFKSNPCVKEWARRSPATMPECFDCEALGICGGGCPYGAMLRYGSIWDIDKRFCTHSQESLEWLIWDLFDKVRTRLGAEKTP